MLSFKTAVLLLLVTAQRGQTILALSLEGAIVEEKEITFFMNKLLKHNRPGQNLDVLTIHSFEDDVDVCVVSAVRSYIRRTRKLRWKDKEKSKNSQLLINHTWPHGPISRDTLSHWTLQCFSSHPQA